MEDAAKLKILVRFMDEISSCINFLELTTKTAAFFIQEFNLSNCTVSIYEKNYRMFTNPATNQTYETLEKNIQLIIKDNKTILQINDLKQDFITQKIHGINNIPSTIIAIPLVSQRNFLGSIILYSEQKIEDKDIFVHFAQKLINQIITTEKFIKLQKSSITDPLTGLSNRAHFTSVFNAEIDHAHSNNKPTSIAMIDVDNFKKYNDTHGHPAGDILLKQLATILQKHCAITETPCRYGGEEFVIIIPQREQQDAQLFVEELRKKVQEQLPTTISIGIITCANSSLSYGSMLSNADQALYKAKNTGKNRVVSYLVLDKNLGIIDIQEASAYGKTE